MIELSCLCFSYRENEFIVVFLQTKFVDRQNGTVNRIPNEDDEDEDENEHMEIDESQVEVSALSNDTLEKLQNILHKILIKQSESNTFNLDSDDRFRDFAEYISKMQSK